VPQRRGKLGDRTREPQSELQVSIDRCQKPKAFLPASNDPCPKEPRCSSRVHGRMDSSQCVPNSRAPKPRQARELNCKVLHRCVSDIVHEIVVGEGPFQEGKK
jgi:hypothetical protein